MVSTVDTETTFLCSSSASLGRCPTIRAQHYSRSAPARAHVRACLTTPEQRELADAPSPGHVPTGAHVAPPAAHGGRHGLHARHSTSNTSGPEPRKPHSFPAALPSAGLRVPNVARLCHPPICVTLLACVRAPDMERVLSGQDPVPRGPTSPSGG